VPAKKPPRRLPRATFHSVAVIVADVERSLAWYTRNFGLDVIEQDGEWVTVGRKGRDGTLHLCTIPEFDRSFSLEPGESGIQFDLPGDFRSSCAALQANGVRFVKPPTKRPWGWYAKIADPDGNEIRLNPK
jgi:catechol 2,3-dioxygenase-like lactoylglutathione lyase family enzyme